MTPGRLTFLILTCLFITACTSPAPTALPDLPEVNPTSAQEQNPMPDLADENPTAATEAASPIGWTITPAQERINLDLTLEIGTQAEAVIPVEGGTLSVTAGDGTRFTLAIPADALLQETRIVMTPVETVSGLPFSGAAQRAYAVHFEPEGLAFNNYATLTIQPSEQIDIEEQIFFGYEQDGQNLFLAPPVVDSSEVQIQILHFSGYGVTKGLLADIEPVRARLGGSEEARLTSAAAELLTRERQRRLAGEGSAEELGQAYEKLVEEFVQKVVEPRVAAAGESCAAGRLAVQTVLEVERQRQRLGGEGSSPIDRYMENIDQLIETAGQACLAEEYELCAQDHIIHRIIPVWLGIERQAQLFGSTEFGETALGQQARRYVDQCLRFELQFESTSTFGDSGFGYESVVSASVPLRIEEGGLDITGQGVLVNDSFDAWADYCTVSKSTGDGFFNVSFLAYETGNKDVDDQMGYVKDLHLGYLPGGTGEQATFTCENGDVVADILPGAWFMPFMMLHEHEMVTNEEQLRYDASAWNILGGELFAERSWQYEGDGAQERGSFKLYHRPGE